MALDRASIKKPVLPKEAVPVESLGGEVIVRGLLLTERLAMFANLGQDGAAPEEAFVHVPRVLARVVLAEDGAPVFSEEEWQIHGSTYPEDVFALFRVAQRLSGLDAEDAKKK
jgi:hypothetical protein